MTLDKLDKLELNPSETESEVPTAESSENFSNKPDNPDREFFSFKNSSFAIECGSCVYPIDFLMGLCLDFIGKLKQDSSKNGASYAS